MGIDIGTLQFIATAYEAGVIRGDFLQLGRQYFYLNRGNPNNEIFQRYFPTQSLNDLSEKQDYADKFFLNIGASTVLSLDASDHEEADIIHDLNTPVPESLYRSFDCIFDGGTFEHVFNLPTMIDSVSKMLRVGGSLMSVNGANDWLGHGFYQFSPEWAFRVFSPENGFEVTHAYLGTRSGILTPVDDPARIGYRLETKSTNGSAYLMFIAKKIRDVEMFKTWPQQSDYSSAWVKNKLEG